MPSLEELITERNNRIDSVPIEFLSAIDKSQIELFRELIALVNELEISEGTVVTNLANFEQINQIVSSLQRSLTQGDYLDALVVFIKQYEGQAEIIQQIIKASLGTFTDSALYEQSLQNSIENAITLFEEDAINTRLMAPLKELLTQNISVGSTLKDMVKNLKEFMLTDEVNLGTYQRYAQQIAFDAFSISDRTYANVIHEDIGVTKFRYSGGILRGDDGKISTRCFCEKRAEKVFDKETIMSWGRRENIGSCEITLKTGRTGWAGINDATTEKTIFNYLGGWNCGHTLIAVKDNAKTDNIN